MIRTERYVINVDAEEGFVHVEIENPDDLKHDSVSVQLSLHEAAALTLALKRAAGSAITQLERSDVL